MTHESTPNWRLVGNFPAARVGFFGTNQMEDFRVKTFFLNRHMYVNRDDILWGIGLFHDHGIPQDEFKFLDATLEKTLVFLGFVVIGIL